MKIIKWLVFYRQEPSFREDSKLTMANLLESHKLVASVDHTKNKDKSYLDSKDQIFSAMQAEVWSPNGEARETIMRLGLNHTSMSVGDVLVAEIENSYGQARTIGFQCAYVGWKMLPSVCKPTIQNLGEVVGEFLKIDRAENEAYEDLHAYHAPSECGNLIHAGYERQRMKLEEKLRMSAEKIFSEAMRRTSNRWLHFGEQR